MTRIRAFVAVHITPPASLRNVLSELRALGPPIKAVEPDNLHVTLKFLGDIDRGIVDDVGRVITEAVGNSAPFEVDLAGLGVFPHAARPSIIWAGLPDADQLVAMAGEIEKGFKKIGFAPEDRKFEPHITLARSKARPPFGLDEVLSAHAETQFGKSEVTSVILFQSELRPEGPLYTPLKKVKLNAAG